MLINNTTLNVLHYDGKDYTLEKFNI